MSGTPSEWLAAEFTGGPPIDVSLPPRTLEPTMRCVEEDVRLARLRVVGPADALDVFLIGPIRHEISTGASVIRDDGEVYNAFAQGRSVHRLAARVKSSC